MVFNADPVPAFYLNANPDLDPGSQTNADPDPGHTLESQKVEFLHVKYTESMKVGNRSKTYLRRYGYKKNILKVL